jgi:hypothetical protein
MGHAIVYAMRLALLIAGLTAMPPRPARGLSAPPSKPALFSNPPPRTSYVQSLFDALIQLGAAVPTSVMLPFKDSWRSEILLLMNGPSPGNDALTYHRNLDPDGEAALLQVRTYRLEKAFPKGLPAIARYRIRRKLWSGSCRSTKIRPDYNHIRRSSTRGHRWIGAARKGLVLRLTGCSHRPGPPGAHSAVWEMIVI